MYPIQWGNEDVFVREKCQVNPAMNKNRKTKYTGMGKNKKDKVHWSHVALGKAINCSKVPVLGSVQNDGNATR